MFDTASRYYTLNTKYYTVDNLTVAYKSRRFLPQSGSLPQLATTQIQENQRLDQIANQFYNNSLRFWLVCDGNNTMNPWDLVTTPGTKLFIPMPQS